MRRALQIVIIAAALGVAVTPLPRAAVERLYSRRVYAVIQPRLTGFSNHLPFALFDAALAAAIIAVPAMWIYGIRRAPRGTVTAAAGRLVLNTAWLAALVYFWFLAAWGLNY